MSAAATPEAEPRASPRAALVSVGNELLLGETIDTNAPWLGQWLAARGIRVVRRWTVGDVDTHIRQALASAVEAAELVVLIGGLGPTPDDRTKAAVADHLARPLVVDAATEAILRGRFLAAGFDEVPPLSRGQAEVPEGSRTLFNPEGTAPGILLDEGATRVVLLPGVPTELRAIAEGALDRALAEARLGQRRVLRHVMVHTTGILETQLAERLEARLAEVPEDVREGIALAYLPDLRGVDLRFTVESDSTEEAERRVTRLLASLEPVLGAWTFEAPSGDLARALADRLRALGQTLAVAESCTGGLVAKRMTDAAGASEVFLGGVVAYTNDAKIAFAGVAEEELEREGAVSEPVARQLAAGAAERFGADTGIGVTGIAGPAGGSEEKPVGTVWIATSVGGRAEATRHHFAGGREAVRERAAEAAIAALHRRLADRAAR